VFDLNLPVFPFDSTAITLSATVWIGVCISVFFNLRFGWTLSGLVIPGYLAPLLLIRPITAAVILFESLVTYWVVMLISEGPRRLPCWSSFFGRDRFFFILVVSVLVRSVFDGWILPHIGRIAVDEYGLNFDYRNNFHSFGLIAVALIANYFWKPGVIRGLIPMLTCVGLTYLLVRFGLVGLTNFNVGNFHLLYEDISTSLLVGPKAYIIVLTTAYLASFFNLRYAWDFNGILIPALLGLLWHDPGKILFSTIECGLILVLASAILKLRWFSTATIEGGRKLLFFFTVCFVYRLTLCHVLPHFFPNLAMSDTFGFGYLLTTLMAVKAHDKRLTVRLIRSVTEISMLGAVIGTCFGYALFVGPDIRFDWTLKSGVAAGDDSAAAVQSTDQTLVDMIRIDKVVLYEQQASGSYQPPVPAELSCFRTALHELSQVHDVDVTSSVLQQVASRLRSINYELFVVQNRYLYLRESSPIHGWGIYVIDPRNPDGMCVEVPRSLDEWGSVESGLCLFRNFPSRGIAIAGAIPPNDITGTADVLKSRESMFAVFHAVFGRSDVLQVRGYTKTSYRQLGRATRDDHADEADFESARSQLWIRGAIPSQLNLKRLKDLTGSYDIEWNDSPLANQLRRATYGNFVELFLNHQDRRRLIGHLLLPVADDDETTAAEGGSGYQVEIVRECLQDWMGEQTLRICPQGSNAYRPAKIEQMLYMDHEVITPLIRLLNEIQPTRDSTLPQPTWLTDEVQSQLLPINAAALALDFQLKIIVDPQTSESYLALVETEIVVNKDFEGRKGWGTFVFRPGLADPFVVEVPRPIFERRSIEFGINLYERPRASVLLTAGAHPFANLDGSADISKVANKVNLFNLVRHVLLREMGDRPLLITQARAIQAPVDADIVLATDDGTNDPEELSPIKKRLWSQLREDQLDVAFVDGRFDTAGYELGILMQATAIQVSENKEVVSLWLSPSLRTKFSEQSDNIAMESQFKACGVSSIEMGLIEYLQQQASLNSHPNHLPLRVTPLPGELQSELVRYVDSSDILILMNLLQEFPSWNFARLVDGSSGQAFLLISQQGDDVPSVLNLTGHVSAQTCPFDPTDTAAIDEFVRARALWLVPVIANHESGNAPQHSLEGGGTR
jgi:hypothetical protein